MLGLVPALLTLVTFPLVARGAFVVAGALLAVAAALRSHDRRSNGSSSAPPAGIVRSIGERYADAAPLLGLLIVWRGSAVGFAVASAALLGVELDAYVRAKAGALGLRLGDVALPVGRLAFLATAFVVGALVRVPAIRGVPSQAATAGLVAFGALALHYGAVRVAVEVKRALAMLAS